jgi:hypothetical protein
MIRLIGIYYCQTQTFAYHLQFELKTNGKKVALIVEEGMALNLTALLSVLEK